MKRLLLPFLLAFFGFFGIVKAQPTLTAANTNVVIGEQFISNEFSGNAALFNAGLFAGANQTWNFAGLVSPFSNLVQILYQPPVAIGANAFPLSNSVIRIGDKFEYLKTSTDSVLVVGLFNNFTEQTYTYNNPVKKLQYPFTFNNTFSDNYAGSMHGPFPTYTFTGSIQVKADGFGTLILPSGTFSNVLRIKSVNISSGFNINTSYVDSITTFEWYLPSIHIPVLKIKKDKYAAPNYTVTEYEAYFLNPNALGIGESISAAINLKTFPNPATSEVTIQASLKTPSEIDLTLIDALGKEVLHLNENVSALGNYFHKFDVSNLPKGVYLVRLKTADQVALRKLLVQ